MTFTDDNLNKLKEAIDLAGGMDEDYRFLNLNFHNIQAFVARLEAAEDIVVVLQKGHQPGPKLFEAWQKVAGK